MHRAVLNTAHSPLQSNIQLSARLGSINQIEHHSVNDLGLVLLYYEFYTQDAMIIDDRVRRPGHPNEKRGETVRFISTKANRYVKRLVGAIPRLVSGATRCLPTLIG